MAYQQQQYQGQGQYLNSQFGDTSLTKVFVGGLAWETQTHTMRRYFEQFGDILEAVVITDKYTARSKGYGFVTFKDPQSAWKACVDPSPVIDGRRANCNLASLRRPSLAPPFAPAQSAFVGSFGYQPAPYSYQQGFMYSPYGYTAYGADYAYYQGVQNPYGGQHYLSMYGVPGTVNTTSMYPYSQPSQSYTALQGYAVPGHQILQISAPNVNPMPNATIPNIQYPTGVAARPQFVVPTHSPQFMQGIGSDQNAG